MRRNHETNAQTQVVVDDLSDLHRRAYRQASQELRLGTFFRKENVANDDEPSLRQEIRRNARTQAYLDWLADLHRQAHRKARRALRREAWKSYNAPTEAAFEDGETRRARLSRLMTRLRARLPVPPALPRLPGARLWRAVARTLRRNRTLRKGLKWSVVGFLSLACLPFAAALLTGSNARIDKGIACAHQHVLVEAANGQPLGMVRRNALKDCPRGAANLRAHRVRDEAVRDPARSWEARAVSVLEGEFLSSSPWVIAGIDIRGPFRVLMHVGRVGGSNPLVSAVELITDQPRGLLRYPMKLYNYAATAIYATTRLRDDQKRLRFVLEHSICMTSTGRVGGGLDLAGSECPRILFRKRFGELSPAEACIWAATLRYPLLGRRTHARHWEIQRKRLNRIKKRAKEKCLQRLRDKGWLSAQQLGAERVRVNKWVARLHRHTVADGRQIFNMLPYAALHPGVTRLVLDEGKAANAPLQDRVRTTLLAGPQRRLLEHIARYSTLAPNARATLAVYEVDNAGRALLRLGYATHYGALRDNGLQPQGSLNKPWIAIRAREAGLTRLCNQRYGNLMNAGGDRGAATCTGAAMVPLSTALARSMNLPFIWAVRQLGIDRLKEDFRTLGYHVPEKVTPPGMALGYEVTISPHLLVRNWARLDARTRGHAIPEKASEPSMFATAVNEKSDGAESDGATRPPRPHLRALLAAPWNGTLRRLRQGLAQAGCTPGIGKTGTVETTTSNQARAKIVVATFACRGRQYLAYARIETNKQEEALLATDRQWPFRMIALSARFLQKQ